MSTEVRKIQIAGARPNDLVRRRRSRRRQEGGGDEDAPISSASGVIAISKLNPDPAADVKLPNPAPATSQEYQIISNVGNNPFGMQKGGSAPPKSNIPPPPKLEATSQVGGVILKPKSKTAKVLLKKKDVAAAATAPQPSGKAKRQATRKVVLKSLVKRMKKTRHAVKNAQSIPLEKVRAALIEKKLIKPTSKAPESVLRQIYSDSLIVAKKTL